MNTQDKLFGDVIVNIIREGIKSEIEKEFDLKKEEIIKRIEQIKGEVVAGILVQMMKQVDINTFSDKMTFTIKIQEIK